MVPEEKRLKEDGDWDVGKDELMEWMRTMPAAELRERLKSRKIPDADVERILSAAGKLTEYGNAGVRPAYVVLFLFQAFLVVEKLFGLYPFGHLPWAVILFPYAFKYAFLVASFMLSPSNWKLLGTLVTIAMKARIDRPGCGK